MQNAPPPSLSVHMHDSLVIPGNVLFYAFQAVIVLYRATVTTVCHNNKITTGGAELKCTSYSECQPANIQHPGGAAETKTVTGWIHILQLPEGRSLTLVSMKSMKGN